MSICLLCGFPPHGRKGPFLSAMGVNLPKRVHLVSTISRFLTLFDLAEIPPAYSIIQPCLEQSIDFPLTFSAGDYLRYCYGPPCRSQRFQQVILLACRGTIYISMVYNNHSSNGGSRRCGCADCGAAVWLGRDAS